MSNFAKIGFKTFLKKIYKLLNNQDNETTNITR